MSKRRCAEPADRLTESRDEDDSKKPKVVESVAETSAESFTHYTIKVYYGDPDQKLPWFVRKLKKEDLVHDMVRGLGFRPEDCVGTKEQLFEKIQLNRPFVTLKMDGRAGLQTLLSTALYQFRWDDDHLYNATMPARGTSTMGTKTYQEILFRHCFRHWSSDEMYREYTLRSRHHIKETIHRTFPHLLQSERDSMLEDVCNFAIDRHDIAPMRALTGNAFEPGTRVMGDDFDAPEFFLSLNDLALRVGDRIHFEYDFGSPSPFIAQILECQDNQPSLPEMVLDTIFGRKTVRATVVEESANKIHSQYPDVSGY
jgi:hypothetical protein